MTPVNLLGIIIDSKLTWQSQIDAVCSRLARVINLLRHLKSLVPKCFLKNAYYAFFHSVMTYGLTVWGNGSTINKVLKLQKSAIRILTGSSYDAHCRPLFRTEGILTVINVYIFRCLMHMKGDLHSYSSVSAIHDYPTRNNFKLDVPYLRLTKSRNWYYSIALRMFNQLLQEAYKANIGNFRKVVIHFFIK